MGTRSLIHPLRSGLAGALFTRTQQRVLGYLFGQAHRAFTVTELISLTGAGSGAVQRELARLTASGLVTVHSIGRLKRYQANAQAPIFDELKSIFRKTAGLADPLKTALAPSAARIIAAFVYGSTAKGEDGATSDVDVMIISDSLTYADAFEALDAVAENLGCSVNPTVYTRAEFAKRIANGNAFVARVLKQPQVWLIGRERDLVIEESRRPREIARGRGT